MAMRCSTTLLAHAGFLEDTLGTWPHLGRRPLGAVLVERRQCQPVFVLARGDGRERVDIRNPQRLESARRAHVEWTKQVEKLDPRRALRLRGKGRPLWANSGRKH